MVHDGAGKPILQWEFIQPGMITHNLYHIPRECHKFHENVINLFYTDERDMGLIRIMLRHIRVPLFDQFMEPGMYPVQARPSGNGKNFGGFRNGHCEVGSNLKTAGWGI